MQFNPLVITKFAVSTVVSIGVTKVISSIIRNNVTATSTKDKVAVASAAFVLGSMVADKTKEYTDDTIDKMADFYYEEIAPKFQK